MLKRLSRLSHIGVSGKMLKRLSRRLGAGEAGQDAAILSTPPYTPGRMGEAVTASPELRETCELPMEWTGLSNAKRSWNLYPMHFPVAMGWLTESFEIAAVSEGMERAGMRLMGGVLSRRAVAARDSRVPAVAGTNIGTTALKTGQRVKVAGGAGIVELHPR